METELQFLWRLIRGKITKLSIHGNDLKKTTLRINQRNAQSVGLYIESHIWSFDVLPTT